MPFEKIENGKHIGMSAKFIQLITQHLNIPIILVPTSTWVESLEKGKLRQCDLFSLIMKTPKREKFLDFSKPYLNIPLVVATRYEQNSISNIEDILDKKIGIQKGYAYAELLRADYPTINLIEVKNVKDGLNQVINNELFGMIGSLPGLAYSFQHNSISDLMISGKLAQTWHLGVGTRNDEPLLINIINKVITQLDEKELQDITNQWISIKQAPKYDYTLLVSVLSIVFVFFAFFLYHHIQLKKLNKLLKFLSITDNLTGIGNRLSLDQQLESNLHLAERYQQQFSIILLDIDYFKTINDQYGHPIGDYALKTVSQLLSKNVREVDILGRWGGEEFLIICPGQTVDGARFLAEKLRKAIDTNVFEHFSNLSCSFGISAYKENDDSNKIIVRADNALYLAKSRGRNKVCVG
jgi:diguanylate cyclase (GGDEF)-like protein